MAEYKVKTAPGFNAAGRRRAGLTLEKGVEQTVDLDKEQLAALEADPWIVVRSADGSDETMTDEGEPASPYEGKSMKDLKAMAVEMGAEIKGIRSKDGVIEAMEAHIAAQNEGDDEDGGEGDDGDQDPENTGEGEEDGDEDEDPKTEVDTTVEVTVDTPMEDLLAIATALEIEGAADMPNAVTLVAAIEAARA